MNVIIIAVLALIVILVMWAIFTGKMGIISSQSQCKARGGICVDVGTCSYQTVGYSCEKNTQVCCVDPMKIS